jgi:NADPH-dependent glutamate synthase beta subunit-like oxidoreductase
MAIVRKKKKGLKKKGSIGGASKQEGSSRRPKFVEKLPPCIDTCPNHNHIREWLMVISKAEDYGKTLDQAYEEAFYIGMETNPFPSICGRVCPHPCESGCNREEKDGAVSINQVERAIGDYALEKNLVPKKLTEETKSEKVAVVGSGPGGISCAYHLARRGYPVTVFEAFPKSGGMLRYGIPDYRLPPDILDAEIDRVLDMGVELKLNTIVGKDVQMEDLRKEYKAVFVALGAHQGYKLGVEGEDASNVFTGTDYLNKVNSGESVDIGDNVVVIGGGDTAIDAARMARRFGANATILYRRTRTEMPAIDLEIVGAEEEGVRIDLLAAPIEIYTKDGKAVGMKCQKMELGEPDDSGRRRPVPIEGDTYDLECSSLIAAISQEPDFTGFDDYREGKDWIKVDEKYKTSVENVLSGGDNINLGLAIDAIYHGRVAALAIDEMITSNPMPPLESDLKLIKTDGMILSYYPESKRVPIKEMNAEERLKTLDAEVVSTYTDEEVVQETKRCMSCGMCFDCSTCWSFCQDGAILKPIVKGEKYKFKLEYCKGCDKCAENCPCGYIEMF